MATRLFRTALVVIFAALIGGTCLAQQPSDELLKADADLATMAVAPTIRYLSMYNIGEEERTDHIAVVCYVLNMISRSPNIKLPQRVGSLLRVDLKAYEIPIEAWEAMVSDKEPYWNLRFKTADGKVAYTTAGHAGIDVAKRVIAKTGCGAPIIRSDWFLSKALTTPHYYNLAGIPDTSTAFYKSLGVDPNTIVELRANRGANIIKSGVTKSKRRVSRWQTPVGGAWVTYDGKKDGDPLKDPFKVPGFNFKHDASEHIAARSNGLHSFALFNGQGKRQDTVPDFIAKDDSDPHGDGILIAPISCIRCHQESGLRPFANDMKELLAGDVDLYSDDADTIRAFYGTEKAAKELARDQEDYDTAVKEATAGRLTAKELSAVVGKEFSKYAYDQVDKAKALKELGVKGLDRLKASTNSDLQIIRQGKAINRVDWEGAFADAALMTKGEP